MPDEPTETVDSTEPTETQATEPAGESNWLDSLPDDLKSAECLKKYKSVEELAKGHVAVQPRLGLEKLAIPGKDDKDGWAAVWTRLGRPETAEGYELPTENMPDNARLDDALVKSFFAEAHQIGLNKQQAAALVRWQATYVGEQVTALDEAARKSADDAVEELKKEWGTSYDERMRLATNAIGQFADKEGKFKAFLDETGLGNDARMIRVMSNIGRALAEDEILGSGHHGQFAMSPTEAQAEIAKLKGDNDYMNNLLGIGSPNKSAAEVARKRWDELHKLAYPNDGG